MLTGPIIEPRSGKVSHLVIMLHGVGADGENLIQLANDFRDILPDAYFVAPNGPQKYNVGEGFVGDVGYQWFPLWGKSLPELIEGANNATKILKEYIDGLLKKLGLDYSKLILMGFSQGSITAVHSSIMFSEKCLAVVGFSGAILTENQVASKPDICLIHGENDDVVPFQQTVFAERKLKAIGVNVEIHLLDNLGHWIEERGIKIAKNFLRKRI